MYIPKHDAEDRLDVLHELITAHPLGTLVTAESGMLEANHLPFLITPPTAIAPLGCLVGHVAKRNLVWKSTAQQEALIIFQGPQAYITPSWFQEKAVSGKVVPTFNYIAVHAYGHIKVIEEPQALRKILHQLTHHFESTRASPWQLDDAPPDYIERLMRAIVGIEIPITRVFGKWKTSKEMSMQDRQTIAMGLCQQDNNQTMADAMLNPSTI